MLYSITKNKNRTVSSSILDGVANGARTHNHSDHNRVLYQLSYGHHARETIPYSRELIKPYFLLHASNALSTSSGIANTTVFD